MDIRQALKSEYTEVRNHYEYCSYRGGLQDNDIVVIAVEGRNITGAVRICSEDGEKVLRGMYVHPQFRNLGIGKAILQFLNARIDLSNCYCLPHAHLSRFYGLIGFREITTEDAPAFLVERLESYGSRNRDPIIIMKKETKAIHQ